MRRGWGKEIVYADEAERARDRQMGEKSKAEQLKRIRVDNTKARVHRGSETNQQKTWYQDGCGGRRGGSVPRQLSSARPDGSSSKACRASYVSGDLLMRERVPILRPWCGLAAHRTLGRNLISSFFFPPCRKREGKEGSDDGTCVYHNHRNPFHPPPLPNGALHVYVSAVRGREGWIEIYRSAVVWLLLHQT